MRIIYRHKEATICRTGYGLAYKDLWRKECVCYPIPFNYIIRLVLFLWWEFKTPRYLNLSKRDHEILTEIRVRRRLLKTFMKERYKK